MSDKLEWRNRHAVLFQYRTVQEAVAEGKYEITAGVEPFVVMDPMPSEDFVTALMAAGRHKDVCDFLAYSVHRRAAVWWGYRSLLTLMEELAAKPPVYRDIADIGAPKPFDLPDWAKMPDLEAEKAAAEAEIRPKAEAFMKETKDSIAQIRAKLPQDLVKLWDDCYDGVNGVFREKYGLTMEELVEKAAKKDAGPDFVIDPKSPIYQATDALKAEIEKVRKETIDKIKQVIPPIDLARRKKLSDDAMQAVFRWVVAPDEVNTKKALDVGNTCPDQPAGLLSLAAAWSFGDLDPTGKVRVATPPGLAGNGVRMTLLNAAMAKGGTRSFAERYKIYADLGVSVVQGKDLWDKTVTERTTAPHVEVKQPEDVRASTAPAAEGYRKWEPKAMT